VHVKQESFILFIRYSIHFFILFLFKRRPTAFTFSAAKYPVSLYGRDISNGWLSVMAAALNQASNRVGYLRDFYK